LLNSLNKKELFQYTRIHSLLVNWCHHSIESRALTCPFKQCNLSACHCLITVKLTQNTYAPRSETLSFFKAICSPPSRSRRVTRIKSIHLFNSFSSFTFCHLQRSVVVLFRQRHCCAAHWGRGCGDDTIQSTQITCTCAHCLPDCCHCVALHCTAVLRFIRCCCSLCQNKNSEVARRHPGQFLWPRCLPLLSTKPPHFTRGIKSL